MRLFTHVAVAALLAAAAAQAAPAPPRPIIETITPRQAAAAGFTILPEYRIIEAARRFLGDPTADLVVERLVYDAPLRPPTVYYDVRTADHPGPGSMCLNVRATDGEVTFMSRAAVWTGTGPQPGTREAEGLPPLLTLEQARAAAEEFVRAHYSPFACRRWWAGPERYTRRQWDYQFFWFPVLSDAGVTWHDYLSVTVDYATGQVTSYSAPTLRPVLCPVVPRVSLEQAVRLAAPYIPHDLNTYPVNEPWLQVVEDEFGLQRLAWHLLRRQEPPRAVNYGVWVDATTGQVYDIDVFLGGPPPARRPRQLPAAGTGIRLRAGSPAGRVISGWVAPRIVGGSLWVRAELLRGFGVRVEADRGRLQVWSAGKVVDGRVLGARFHSHGWWVPLRPTAERLGWRVAWLAASREAVVIGARSPIARAE